MVNIILVCEHGASTSMLTDRMKDAAKQLGVDAVINAYPYTKLDELIDGADIVLLGPQVRFKKNLRCEIRGKRRGIYGYRYGGLRHDEWGKGTENGIGTSQVLTKN